MKNEVRNWVDSTKKELIINYKNLGLKASGQWAESLEDEVTYTYVNNNNIFLKNVNIKLLNEKYTGALIKGRKPTTKKGNTPLKVIIRKWIDDKRITPKDGISKKSLAFLIARKIHKEGIKVPNKYNSGKLLSNVLTDKKTNELLSVIKKEYKESITNITLNQLKKK